MKVKWGRIMLDLIASIENIKQYIRENIVMCWFYETSITILHLPTLANLAAKLKFWFRKTDSVIYYFIKISKINFTKEWRQSTTHKKFT